jgi:hypothetical protein
MSDIPRIGVVSDDAKEACAKCAYFFNPANADHGLCRRHPPTVLIVGTVQTIGGPQQALTQSFYPPVAPIGWCGEFSPRSVEQVVRSDKGTHVFFDTGAVVDYDEAGIASRLEAAQGLNRSFADQVLAGWSRPAVLGEPGSLDPGKDVVEPVVTAGPEQPLPDPSGGGEDGSKD